MDLSKDKGANDGNLAAPSKKELFDSFDKLKGEIFSCRKSLNQLNIDKEAWYKKRESLSKDIKSKIDNIKETRKKRDSLTQKIKGLKEQRTKLNEETRKKISEATKIKDEIPAKGPNANPHGLKRDIDGIELKLETEDMPFEKEKELSKKLKMLKRSFEEASGIMNSMSKIRALNSEISVLKKSSYAVHNEIKNIAEEGQKLHENFLEESRSIDALKAEEKEAFKKFSEFKKMFNEANFNLKKKLEEMNEIRGGINKFKLEESEKRKLEEAVLIKNKEHEVEEKIKAGKKITTEDFLVFQESLKGRR